MKKRAPRLRTDKEAEKFLEKDLSDYINPAHMVPLRFEFQNKNKAVNIRLSDDLLNAIRDKAKKEGIPYQRFIRIALEKAVQSKSAPLHR
ncbi:MAG: CopG family transcriptional regulator [Nitrospinae bacterium]|nr:CopG family transcriptional regulator [Nitrospinota bacterium]